MTRLLEESEEEDESLILRARVKSEGHPPAYERK